MASRAAWDLARGGDIDVGSDSATMERPNPLSGLGKRRLGTWVGHWMPLPRADVMAQPERLRSRWRSVRCAVCGPLSGGGAGLAAGPWGSFLGLGLLAQAGLVLAAPVRTDPTSSTEYLKQSSTQKCVVSWGSTLLLTWSRRMDKANPLAWGTRLGGPGASRARGHLGSGHDEPHRPGLRQQKCVSPSSGGGKFETRVRGSFPSWLADEHHGWAHVAEREGAPCLLSGR